MFPATKETRPWSGNDEGSVRSRFAEKGALRRDPSGPKKVVKLKRKETQRKSGERRSRLAGCVKREEIFMHLEPTICSKKKSGISSKGKKAWTRQ